MIRAIVVVTVVLVFVSPSHSLADAVDTALRNGCQAQEALVRSHRVLHAYLKRLDPDTGLLPRRGGASEFGPWWKPLDPDTGLLPRTAGHNTWYVADSAADLYPFLVMAAYFTDRDVFHRDMLEILRNEIRHSTRLDMLSDNVLPGSKGFEHADVDLDRLIFGSCEYVKDGLLPLTELLGHHVWYDRMLGIVDDIITHAPYDTKFGRLPSLSAEVNGGLLQVLSRLAYYTGEQRYIDQAITIGDFYFNEVIPKSNGLPAHMWDLENGIPATDAFRFDDHGNEIVGGLSELVLYLKETRHSRYEDFKEPLTDTVDLLLKHGLNPDGIWYSMMSPSDRKVIDSRHAHCWGYLFNAVYTTYLITNEKRFLDATQRALNAVTNRPTIYLDDPNGSNRHLGSNAYSDAIESAIVFLNRLPDHSKEKVLDECVKRFLGRQRADGIIEDWYGDGNYVRTALMYALMKSQGTWAEPWRSDVRLGAAVEDSTLLLSVQSDRPWHGRIRFDVPRSKLHFHMPVNYPRLNEFPEWFVVDLDRLYSIEMNGQTMIRVGGELARGLEINTGDKNKAIIRVSTMPGPPYGN